MQDDALKRFLGQRFQIDFIRQRLIRHDGGGVGIDEHHVHAGFLEHAARLRAGIVKFRRLSDHDGAGANHQYLFNRFVQRHCISPPIMEMKRSNRNAVSCGPALASGWNCTVKALSSG